MKKKTILDRSIVLLLIISLVSAIALGCYFYELHGDSSEFRWLRQLVFQKQETDDGVAGHKISHLGADNVEKNARVEAEFLSRLQRLQADNEDLVGWIRIPGTRIDYPVMHTPKQEEYYLRRNFLRENSLSGTPFVHKKCTFQPRSDNCIIYGHNMKNGTMFADLLRYKEEDFWRDHGEIEFYTLLEKQTYEIFAVVPTEVYTHNTFDCYSLIHAKDEDAFDAYVLGLQQASLYPTGVSVAYGDQLLTLSTCAYHKENGRFVVVGRYRLR